MGFSHPLNPQSLDKLGHCWVIGAVWSPRLLSGAQYPEILRPGPCELAVSSSGEKHLWWLDPMKPLKVVPVCGSMCSLVIHPEIVIWDSSRCGFELDFGGCLQEGLKASELSYMGLALLHLVQEERHRARPRCNSSSFFHWASTMWQALFQRGPLHGLSFNISSSLAKEAFTFLICHWENWDAVRVNVLLGVTQPAGTRSWFKHRQGLILHLLPSPFGCTSSSASRLSPEDRGELGGCIEKFCTLGLWKSILGHSWVGFPCRSSFRLPLSSRNN